MRYFLVACLVVLFLNNTSAQLVYPGAKIGQAKSKADEANFSLTNNVLTASWEQKSGVIYAQHFSNDETNESIDWDESPWFFITMKDGVKVTSNDFKLAGKLKSSSIKGNQKAVRTADQLDGTCFSADLYCEKIGLKLHWNVLLKDGSNYVKHQFSFSVEDSLNVDQIALVELPDKTGMEPGGVVAGSPITGNNFFFAMEHPVSQIESSGQQIFSFIKRYEAVRSTHQLMYSAVWGVVPEKQMRRGFLYYLERERAASYHQQLHYNSWYDISWIDSKLDEKSCLDRIQTFADSLITKRGVNMDAFLFDDGWDDNKSLWQFNNGFPNGFSKMKALADKYDADLGVWISPWGGYDEAKLQRLEYGKKQDPPFETNDNGFSLSGKIYYKRFLDVATNFVKKQGVSMFKFDGVGAGDGTEGDNVSYEKDINALLKLVGGLREAKPDLYFSLTIGTWPSPYWLNYGDAIWRNGADTDTTGVGSKRQQWITYRDAQAYKNIVERGPLYPLNALMYHGICIADNGLPKVLEMSDKDIADEIWSFFGTGTSLQELYINPHKLSSKNWDCLAEAIKWSKSNEQVFIDTHWVGGDPGKEEVYGWAAWNDGKGVLTLRNPSEKPSSIKIDIEKIFELPDGAAQKYLLQSARKADAANSKLKAVAGKAITINLKPFEVVNYNAVSAK